MFAQSRSLLGELADTAGSLRFSSIDLAQAQAARVKLYRLNTDGSWDDCGTGRIVCLYREPLQRVASKTESSDAWLYHETGEATLCVQSEVTKEGEQAKVLAAQDQDSSQRSLSEAGRQYHHHVV